MAIQKHQALFERLYAKTLAGEIKWQETLDKGAFAVSFSDYSLEVSQERPSENEEGSPLVLLTIRNAEGAIVEHVSDGEVGRMISGAERSAFYRKTEAIYELARRAALGADKALDQILKELGDDIPF